MRLPALVLAPSLAAALCVAGCGDSTVRSAERFCGELRAHANEIQTPPTKADEIPALITLFSKMGEVAPLDIQTDWETLYGALKTANTVDVNNAASVQQVGTTALAATDAAQHLVAWAQSNCAIDLQPVAVIDGGAAVDTTPTTLPAP